MSGSDHEPVVHRKLLYGGKVLPVVQLPIKSRSPPPGERP